jgi:hypothetical protein
LFGGIAHAASVEQHDVGENFGASNVVTTRDELSGDGFAIALIHLATVSFNENTRHRFPQWGGKIRHSHSFEKR